MIRDGINEELDQLKLLPQRTHGSKNLNQIAKQIEYTVIENQIK